MSRPSTSGSAAIASTVLERARPLDLDDAAERGVGEGAEVRPGGAVAIAARDGEIPRVPA